MAQIVLYNATTTRYIGPTLTKQEEPIMATLNIGLLTNKGALVTAQDVAAVLHLFHASRARVSMALEEPTLIIETRHAQYGRVLAAARFLEQDCIAVQSANGEGQLIGDNLWGDFDTARFQPYEHKGMFAVRDGEFLPISAASISQAKFAARALGATRLTEGGNVWFC